MIKIKTFVDYEDNEQLEIDVENFLSKNGITRLNRNLVDVKFSSAVGIFDNIPYHTVSAMVIWNGR